MNFDDMVVDKDLYTVWFLRHHNDGEIKDAFCEVLIDTGLALPQAGADALRSIDRIWASDFIGANTEFSEDERWRVYCREHAEDYGHPSLNAAGRNGAMVSFPGGS